MWDKIKNLGWKQWIVVAATAIVAGLQATGAIDLTSLLETIKSALSSTPTPTP